MGKVEKIPVEVPADFLAAAERAVAGGEFVSVEQVVASALRSWQVQREADLAKLRSLIDEGLASPVEAWEGVSSVLAEGRRRLAERGG
jgi:Arc/MetJ-type ribon-helix-helix transcriptional regulator